jgi:hypothetical protein
MYYVYHMVGWGYSGLAFSAVAENTIFKIHSSAFIPVIDLQYSAAALQIFP